MALITVTLGTLMVFINQSIVLIALPDIFRGIDLNPLTPGNTGYMLWMLMGFGVVMAVLVVTLGTSGDITVASASSTWASPCSPRSPSCWRRPG